MSQSGSVEKVEYDWIRSRASTSAPPPPEQRQVSENPTIAIDERKKRLAGLRECVICVICMYNITVPSPHNGSNEGRSLGGNCHHTYHLGCLLRWSTSGDACPLCREPLRLSETTPFKFVEVTEGIAVPESEKFYLAEANIKKLAEQFKLMTLSFELDIKSAKVRKIREKTRREIRIADHVSKSIIHPNSVPALVNLLRTQVNEIRQLVSGRNAPIGSAMAQRRQDAFNTNRGLNSIDLDGYDSAETPPRVDDD